MKLFDYPTGSVVTVKLGAYRCGDCGKYLQNVEITGVLQARISNLADGLPRRDIALLKSPCGCLGITGVTNVDLDHPVDLPWMPSQLSWKWN